MKKGAPKAAVTTPTGSSDGAKTSRAMRSEISRNNPPARAECRKSRRWSGPIISLTACGTISPTNPIIPATETEKEASQVARIRKTLRTVLTGQPSDRAVSSPRLSKFISPARY